MRKPDTPDENQQGVNVKKRRRSTLDIEKQIGMADEACKQLQEQLEQLQAKVVVREQERKRLEDDLRCAQDEWSRVDAEASLLAEQLKTRVEEMRKRTEESAQVLAARTQVEVQRQRLEEALLLAKERKRAEELSTKAVSENESIKYTSEENLLPDSEVNVKAIDIAQNEKSIATVSENADLITPLLDRLNSGSSEARASALNDLSLIARDQSFGIISKAFDDPSPEVRNAAAKALYNLQPDPSLSFARALREATTERRRNIGSSLAASGLASDAIASLAAKRRESTYGALALLFLMAKAGELRPLMKAIEDGPNQEVRLAVVNLLALSGRPEIIPPLRRLAVRSSLPSEVRSAVMEAVYQMSSQQREMVSGQ